MDQEERIAAVNSILTSIERILLEEVGAKGGDIVDVASVLSISVEDAKTILTSALIKALRIGIGPVGR